MIEIFLILKLIINVYFCKTCDKAFQRNIIPCQAVANKLNLVELPKSFQGIDRLERLLVSRRILFKKVAVIPKGKFLEMKVSICNIPITEVDVKCKMSLRSANSNGLLMMKLKGK